MGRYRPRPLAVLTIPPEHQPVPGGETVRLRFFGSVAQDRVERARMLRARRLIADSRQIGFDADMVPPKSADNEPQQEPTPLEEAQYRWPGGLVVEETLHSIVSDDDEKEPAPTDPGATDDEREAWIADQSSAALAWLAEQQYEAAGLLRETEAQRGEG